MDRLYAPWRTEYISGEKIKGCVFCHIVKNIDKDEELGVLHREKDFFIVMNKYPYTVGHFMIIPNCHTDKLEELDSNTWMKMNKFAQKGVLMLKEVLNAGGVNLGMNLGQIGGAGIAEHIHLHLVPRWMGDTNFISSIGNTRIYSTDFERIYKKLKEKAPLYFNDN